jgi:two-component system sensor histidine kinase ChvG
VAVQAEMGFDQAGRLRAAPSARSGAARADAAQPAPADRLTDRPAAPEKPASSAASRRSRRQPRSWPSPLTRRILALNVLSLLIPVIGLLYLDQYREGLVQTELASMRTEAEMFSSALAASGVVGGSVVEERLLPEMTQHTVRRLVAISKYRARLFDADGTLMADSFRLVSAGGKVDREVLPPLRSVFSDLITDAYEWVGGLLPRLSNTPIYHEAAVQHATDYQEVVRALDGQPGTAVRSDRAGSMVLSVAVPVQRYRQVLGALFLTSGGAKIEAAVRAVRLDILKVFGIALAVTTLLSLYLAGTIARPISRLAAAADQVRRKARVGSGPPATIPDFTRRNDEIGDLSAALRDMTDALAQRIHAIERFAADVAHEIKNPLSSLRSAVETAARVEDPAQQRRLMGIIQDDVQRLDRLITDISDASRLDAELSRSVMESVDIGHMLHTLVDIHEATAAADAPRLVLEGAIAAGPAHQDLRVHGIESRLVQVLQNLISNAISFSPPGGVIRLGAARIGTSVEVRVADSGPGIPPGKLEAVFDRFYSERPQGEKFGTHSGLGLSISRQIVEMHGGTLAAANRQDGDGRVTGACFTIRLPADHAAPPRH